MVVEKSLANNTFVIFIEDPEIGNSYRILVNQEYRVLDVDFCIDFYENLYLLEIVILVRQNGSIHLLAGFNY